MQSRLGLLTPPESSLSPDQQSQPVCVNPFNSFQSPLSPNPYSAAIEGSRSLDKAAAQFQTEGILQKRPRDETNPPSNQGMESSGDICAKLRKLAVDSTSSNNTSQPHAKESPEPSLIDQAKAFARSHKGECLSEKCANRLQPLSFKCLLGHTWTNNLPLNQGLWCKKCTNKLAIARKLADSHGGI